MGREDILQDVVKGFGNRKFAAGLCVALIDFLLDLDVPDRDIKDQDSFFDEFPRREFRSPGKVANTLIVDIGSGQTLSLRPFYNQVETYFRAEQKRFDYPACAPHATQAWRDYLPWLDAMCSMSEIDLRALRDEVTAFVLERLPSQAFDPSTLVREPPLFRALLEDFDLSAHPGEKSGAAYQGVVFGFVRADNPHLQVEINKVRAGSKRLQRVGDIDAWEGARLAITAEVKQYGIADDAIDQFVAFGNEASMRGAIGIVCALSFEGDARSKVGALGLNAMDLDDMRRIVDLWDPMKQRTAVASLVYYVKHVEQNSALADRLDAFLAAAAQPTGTSGDGSGSH